jgi:hypothetical protein
MTDPAVEDERVPREDHKEERFGSSGPAGQLQPFVLVLRTYSNPKLRISSSYLYSTVTHTFGTGTYWYVLGGTGFLTHYLYRFVNTLVVLYFSLQYYPQYFWYFYVLVRT